MKDVKKKVGTIKNKAAAVTTHTKLKKKIQSPTLAFQLLKRIYLSC
jgi:hypothetical protein